MEFLSRTALEMTGRLARYIVRRTPVARRGRRCVHSTVRPVRAMGSSGRTVEPFRGGREELREDCPFRVDVISRCASRDGSFAPEERPKELRGRTNASAAVPRYAASGRSEEGSTTAKETRVFLVQNSQMF